MITAIMPESTPLVGVIIPFRNEEKCLPAFLQSLRKTLDSIGEHYEIIFVDDGSNDDGWNIIEKEAKIDQHIRGIRLTRHFGKENSIRAGLNAVSARTALIMDSDMQHPPELIPEMIQIWKKKNIPVIQAVKTKPSRKNALSRAIFRFYCFFLRKTADIDFYNRTDFILIDRKIVDRINNLPERISFFRGIVAWFGYPSYKIEFEVKERISGKSSWSFIRSVGLAIDGITIFTSAPLRFVTACSIIFIILSLALIVQTLYMKLSGKAQEGFTTVIICILIVGSVVTIALGIIGEYIARIYEELKQRPIYIVKETTNLYFEEDMKSKKME
jgi:glycosyltransferase involved in cell wall biosynthesis